MEFFQEQVSLASHGSCHQSRFIHDQFFFPRECCFARCAKQRTSSKLLCRVCHHHLLRGLRWNFETKRWALLNKTTLKQTNEDSNNRQVLLIDRYEVCVTIQKVKRSNTTRFDPQTMALLTYPMWWWFNRKWTPKPTNKEDPFTSLDHHSLLPWFWRACYVHCLSPQHNTKCNRCLVFIQTNAAPSKQKTSHKPLPLPNLPKESEPFAFPQRWWLSVQFLQWCFSLFFRRKVLIIRPPIGFPKECTMYSIPIGTICHGFT